MKNEKALSESSEGKLSCTNINTQMHICSTVVSRTISLELSAYERLKAAKREGESFSDVVNRVLGDNPSLTEFHGLLSKEAAEEVAETIAQMRREEIELQGKEMEQ